MARLFISYRRKDSSGYAQTLHEDLLQAFPGMEVFRDLESIAAGEDFVDAIERELDRCNVVLVLVGPHWLSMTDAQGKRRLDNPNDPVRMEIARALTRRGVRVIPVLVGGAVMPDAAELPEELSALGRRNAHEMTDKRWQYDFGELCGVLEKLPGMPMRSAATDSTTQSAANRSATGDDDLPIPESLKKPVGRVIGAARKFVWGVGIFSPSSSSSRYSSASRRPLPNLPRRPHHSSPMTRLRHPSRRLRSPACPPPSLPHPRRNPSAT